MTTSPYTLTGSDFSTISTDTTLARRAAIFGLFDGDESPAVSRGLLAR